MSSTLRSTIRDMLTSETFTADELVPVLVARGHDAMEVRTTIHAVEAELVAEASKPAQLDREARRRRAARLVRFGVFWLALFFPLTLMQGAGLMVVLLVFVIGASFIATGMRSLRR